MILITDMMPGDSNNHRKPGAMSSCLHSPDSFRLSLLALALSSAFPAIATAQEGDEQAMQPGGPADPDPRSGMYL